MTHISLIPCIFKRIDKLEQHPINWHRKSNENKLLHTNQKEVDMKKGHPKDGST